MPLNHRFWGSNFTSDWTRSPTSWKNSSIGSKGNGVVGHCIRSERRISRYDGRNENIRAYQRPSRILRAQDTAAPALLAPGRPVLNYRALGNRTQDLIRTLRGLGIAPADRIAVALPRGADSALALIAVASAAVCVPVNPDLTADELQRYFSELKLAALVTRADVNSASRDVARALDIAVIDFVPGPQDDLGGCAFIGPSVGPASTSGPSRGDDDAFILLTSGTAARPKMAPLTHRNVCLSAYNAGHVLSLTSRDRLLNVLPLFHAMA
ncbi:acyl-CoA synthetase (AMP-forming)/AMP-acid ligase II [Bradyrhizobium sp. USDA 326]